MKRVTIPIAKRLIESQAEPSISIYMTADQRSPGGPGDRDRLRRLLRRASGLLSHRLGRRQVDALLTPVAERAREPWPDARSFAFFRSPGASAFLTLPVSVPELAIVSSTFHTKPLVGALDGGHAFALLAIGEGMARLYEGDARRLRRVDEELPGRRRSTGDRGAWYRAIDACVQAHLEETEAPLVVAGERREMEAFRSMTRYPWIVDTTIECDLGQVHVEDLHAPAFDIVQEDRASREEAAIARYLAAEATGSASDDLAAVAHAAVAGRVPLLVHERGAHVWGALDRRSGAVVLRSGEPRAGDADVIDDLCEIVLQHGGDVVEVAPERMPCNRPVCAILRTGLRWPRLAGSIREWRSLVRSGEAFTRSPAFAR